jgi:hypothetical protein
MLLRCTFLLLWLTCLLTSPGAALAEAEESAPAVRGPYVEGTLLSYGYTHANPVPVPKSPSIDAHEFVAGIAATIPLTRHFGARAGIWGGGGMTEYSGPLGTEMAGDFGISAQVEAFWRDPRWGELGIGYRYFAELDNLPIEFDRTIHSLIVSGAAFIGDVDAVLQYSYASDQYRRAEPAKLTDTSSSEVAGSLEWYAMDSLSAGIAASWYKNTPEYSNLADFRVVEVGPSLTWLLPTGDTRYGSISAWGRYQLQERNPRPGNLFDMAYGSMESDAYRIGLSIRIHFPGVQSLRQLSREVR